MSRQRHKRQQLAKQEPVREFGIEFQITPKTDLGDKQEQFVFDCVRLLYEKAFVLGEDPFGLMDLKGDGEETVREVEGLEAPEKEKESAEVVSGAGKEGARKRKDGGKGKEGGEKEKDATSALVAKGAGELTAVEKKTAENRLKLRKYQQLYVDWLRLVLDRR